MLKQKHNFQPKADQPWAEKLRIIIKLGVFLTLSVLAFLSYTYFTQAQIPDFVNYQGRLRDVGGNPIIVPTTIQFSLYSHITNGAPTDNPSSVGPLLWTETYNGSGGCAQITPGTDGVFAQHLGDCVPFPAYLDFTQEYYLGVKIGADAEASPRIPLSSHPYAFTAKRLNVRDENVYITSENSGNIVLQAADDILFYDTNNELGVAGEILSSTGTGIDWISPSSFSAGSLWDLDHDTGVQIEEGADDDTLRIDTAGSQRMAIDNTGNLLLSDTEPASFINPGNLQGLLFRDDKFALRIGENNNNEWDDVNVGRGSFASGRNNIVSGNYSTAFGGSNNINDVYATALGRNNTVTGSYAVAGGYQNTAGGYASAVFGQTNQVTDRRAMAWGLDNIASQDEATAWGRNTRASANYATSWGRDTQASGNYSTAFGYQNTASQDYGLAFGYQNTVGGRYATGWGGQNTVNGQYGTAWGSHNTASGAHSTAFGYYSEASAENGTAIGDSLANSNYMTAIGRFNENVVGQSLTNWVDTDQLFVIGNGSGWQDANRSNALTILKNGTITAPTFSLAEINTAGNTALTTKEYVDSAITTGTNWTQINDAGTNYLKPIATHNAIAFGTGSDKGWVSGDDGMLTMGADVIDMHATSGLGFLSDQIDMKGQFRLDTQNNGHLARIYTDNLTGQYVYEFPDYGGDFVITDDSGASNGDLLTWNGTQWVTAASSIVSSNVYNSDGILMGDRTVSGGGLHSLSFINITGFSIDGAGSFPGAVYNADYSANYTNRSLVDKEYVDAQLMWEIVNGGERIQPKNNSVKQIFVEENSNSYTQFKVRNNNDTGNGAGAIIELKGSGADYTNNMYIGKYGASFWIPELRDNGAVLTDKNLVIGTASATNEIHFVTGNSYSDLKPVVVADNEGFRYTSDLSATFVDRTLVDKGYVDNVLTSVDNIYTANGTLTNTREIFKNGNNFSITGTGTTTLGAEHYSVSNMIGTVRLDNGGVYLTGMNNSLNKIDVKIDYNGFMVTDAINNKGIEYSADYSANYTNRSLVDKEYIDNAITASANNIYTANGTLTGNRTIDSLAGYNSSTLTFTGNSRKTMEAIDNSNYGSVLLSDSTGLEMYYRSGATFKGFDFDNGDALFTDTDNSRGLEYAANYSANYTNRSLVDKEYVDGLSKWIANGTALTTVRNDTSGGDVSGDGSMAIGVETHAGGWGAFSGGYRALTGSNNAFSYGYDTNASGGSSVALGRLTTSSGWYSMATNRETTASGDFATAINYKTNADGDGSFSAGISTNATGDYSSAFGNGTISQNMYMSSLGTFNIGTNNNTVMEVGVGTGSSNRANAFEIYADGSVLAPEFSIAEINAGGNHSLATKEYVDNAIVSSGSSPWTKSGTSLSPTAVGDDILLNTGETLSISDLVQGSIPFIGTSGLVSQDNNNLFWNDADNRLGIGTTDPNYSLAVVGTGSGTNGSLELATYADTGAPSGIYFHRSRGTEASPAAITNSMPMGGLMTGGYDGTNMVAYSAGMQMDATEDWSNSAHGTRLFFSTTANGTTGMSTKMVIDNNGRVGIGSAITPNALLDVRGDAIFNDDAGDYDFRIEGDSDENLFFTDAGNNRVGIGTATPSVKLQVNGQTRSSSFRSANGTAGSPSYRFDGDTNTGLFRAVADNLAFTTGGSEAMRIDASGNLGLGITVPTYRMTIAGGALMLDGIGAAPTASQGYAGIYTNNGELYAFDESANSTQISPHDENGKWWYNSTNLETGSTLQIKMEDLTKDLNKLLGGGYILENGILVDKGQSVIENLRASILSDDKVIDDLREALKNIDVDELENKIDDNENLINEINSSMEGIIDEVKQLWEKVTKNSDDIDDLKKENDELKKELCKEDDEYSWCEDKKNDEHESSDKKIEESQQSVVDETNEDASDVEADDNSSEATEKTVIEKSTEADDEQVTENQNNNENDIEGDVNNQLENE